MRFISSDTVDDALVGTLPQDDDIMPVRRGGGYAQTRASDGSQANEAQPGRTCKTSKRKLIGNSLAMRAVHKAISQVAPHDVNVLITGETGTGKELIAKAICEASPRVASPFLALNCAAVPETLLESELFGHERGAFSGADRRRVGKFEQYDGGTILLDEIGDMPLPLQAKVLRLFQDQSFERVGGNELIRTNVRLIASTHRDLKALVAEGRFREDLFYRLSVFTIHVPPLRDRDDDVLVLVRHFVRQYSDQFGFAAMSATPEAIERLRGHTWLGNVRELQNVIQQALLRAGGQVITAEHFPPLMANNCAKRPDATPGCFDVGRFLDRCLSTNARDLYSEMHRELDRLSLCRVLNYTNGNQHLAARILGIARQTLRSKMREAGVHIARHAY